MYSEKSKYQEYAKIYGYIWLPEESHGTNIHKLAHSSQKRHALCERIQSLASGKKGSVSTPGNFI